MTSISDSNNISAKTTSFDETQDDPNSPLWLSSEYDEKHREESEPLFGTGSIDLHDPEPIQSKADDDNHDNDMDEPVFSKALRSLRNVFQSTTSLQHETKQTKMYGSMDDSLKKPTRVGQPLLFRKVLSEVDESGEQSDDDTANAKAKLLDDTGVDFEWPDSKKKKENKKNTKLRQNKKNDGIVFSTGTVEESNPFGKSNKLTPEAAEAYKPHMPRHNPVLWMFHLIEGLSFLSSLFVAISQAIPFFIVPSFNDIIQQVGLVALVVKCDIILICVIFILNEWDVPLPCIQNSGLLKVYIGRGFLYSFIGSICVESAYSDRMKDVLQAHKSSTNVAPGALNEQDWIGIFMEASAWFMVGMGLLYMILGIFCLKRLRDKLHQQEIDSWADYRHGMKRWRELYT